MIRGSRKERTTAESKEGRLAQTRVILAGFAETTKSRRRAILAESTPS
jgi:hypothetical protein